MALVELTERRTRLGKTFSRGPRQFRHVVSIAPLHWQEGALWYDVDPTWVPGAGGAWKVAAAQYQCDVDPTTCTLRYRSRTLGDVVLSLATINGAAPAVVTPQFSADLQRLRLQSLGGGVSLQVVARPQGPEVYRFVTGPTIPVLVWSVDESQALGAIGTNLLSVEGFDNRSLTAPSRVAEVLERNRQRFVEMLITKSAETLSAGRRTYTVTEQMTGRTRWRDPVTRVPEWRVGELEFPVLLDVQVIETVAAGTDDGYADTNGPWYSAGNYLLVNATYGPAFRFTTVNVPQGATITSAVLRVKVWTAGTGAGTLYGQAVDDAPSWANNSANHPTGMAKTTASVAFSGFGSTGFVNFTVTALIQEIVSRAGWVANNAMRLGAASMSGASTRLSTLEYDAANAARLTIDYTTGPPVVTTAPFIWNYPGHA